RYFRMARTLLGRPVYWTGVYFLDGLLVDSGPPNLAREMARLCRELAVHQCVTSHHHEDHSGNHRLLQEQFHIVPLAHAGGVGRIAAPESRPQLYRRVAFGVPAPAETQPAGDWVETPRFRLQVVPTPGHAEDHIALWEPERRWLFSGDLFLGPRLKYLRSDEDIYALLDSLRRVIALEPETLFCQHRGRVENAGSALRQKLDSLVELGERIRALAGKGMDEEAIARALPGSDLVWRVWTGGHFSKRNFVHAFLRQTPRS
ncbi:MAG TPA: MBL fold metallo-hydrolase, partial [Terriglobales bacterium]|nr:MBL fold metallo-hydrolase [Terriglobales bacterium]